jgi:ribA/ribD-fused uncharacterized protein
MTPVAHDVRTVTDLVARVRDGARPEYVHFWGGRAAEGCLSQWWPADFKVNGRRYASAEHYMMVTKALLFGDRDTADRIHATTDPAEAKTLGRTVRGYTEARWAEHRFEVVVIGNVAKFAQNHDLRDYLLSTADRVLVEASPKDSIWGIGLTVDDPRAHDPATWGGLNLLGFALMEARARLRG